MTIRDDGAQDLTAIDCIGVGLLAVLGLVVPPLLGPSVETVGLAVLSTAAAGAWVLLRSGLLRHRPRAGGGGVGPTTGGRHTPVL